MSLVKRTLVCVAMLVTMIFFSTTAFGELLNPDGSPCHPVYQDTWYGSTHFAVTDDEGALTGDIDYAVFRWDQFPYVDSGYTVPNGYYAYVYQIKNTGEVALSDFTMSIDQAVSNLDSFVLLGEIEGTKPNDTDICSGSGGYVEWIFTQNALLPDSKSAGLVYLSPKAPMATTTGSVTNGGGSIGIDAVLPVPGPNDIPEPGTFILLAIGLGLFAVRRFSNR
jgi:hypothetical protein